MAFLYAGWEFPRVASDLTDAFSVIATDWIRQRIVLGGGWGSSVVPKQASQSVLFKCTLTGTGRLIKINEGANGRGSQPFFKTSLCFLTPRHCLNCKHDGKSIEMIRNKKSRWILIKKNVVYVMARKITRRRKNNC